MIAKLIRNIWAKQIGGGPGNSGVRYVESGGPEHRALLAGKLFEEAAEVAGAPWDVNEYGDVMEVLLQLAHYNGITDKQIFDAMLAKRNKKGGFGDGAVYFADAEHHVWAREKNNA